ncbi:hypothetical protein [Henriciella mobilis]|uniref:hypothetical protein n=1 Tax=Henriciella mobilis TaxID=2305467 RepID=UPI0011C3AE91|nr:hypothetical protein [Henriciella mobilis]
MWQVGVGLAHFIHATFGVSFPGVLFEPQVMMRLMSAVAAFLAGLAALTERKGGAWLAGLSTFMFATVTIGLIQGRHDVSLWRDNYIYLSILTTLFLALVVLRREEDSEPSKTYDAVEAN